jgi:aminoglycoside phosphotransferase (APT) family kinase protein
MGSQLHLELQASYEAFALQELYQSGRTPKLWYLDDTKSVLAQGVLVEDFLAGRPLDYQTDLPEAAKILADIHALPIDNSKLQKPDKPLSAIVEESQTLLARYKSLGQYLPLAEPYLQRFFLYSQSKAASEQPMNDAQRHIVSTELNSRNFIIAANGRGSLVDWEKPILSLVVQDLAHFLVPTTTAWKTETILNRAEMEDFLELYARAVDSRFDLGDLQASFATYLSVTCLRALSWCAMAYGEYTSPSEGKRALRDPYTYSKIKQFLEPDFLNFITMEFFPGI